MFLAKGLELVVNYLPPSVCGARVVRHLPARGRLPPDAGGRGAGLGAHGAHGLRGARDGLLEAVQLAAQEPDVRHPTHAVFVEPHLDWFVLRSQLVDQGSVWSTFLISRVRLRIGFKR